jgi:hypothetical protein
MAFNRLTRGTAVVGGIVITGNSRTRGIKSNKRTAATIADGASMVLTAAHTVTNTLVSTTPTTARALTTATGAQIIALMGADVAVGDCSEVTIVNLAPSAATLTLTAGASGVTLVGSAAIVAASSATFIVRYDSSTAVTFYRK